MHPQIGVDASDAALLHACAEKAVLQGESCHNEPFKVGRLVGVVGLSVVRGTSHLPMCSSSCHARCMLSCAVNKSSRPTLLSSCGYIALASPSLPCRR